MILINLLPHREAQKKARKQAFVTYTALAGLVGMVLGGFWFMQVEYAVSAQQSRNDFLRTETVKLENQIKDIAALKDEISDLKSRQAAVEELQSNRNVAVALLNELLVSLPKGVAIQAVKQNGMSVTLTGLAESNERVAEFIRNASAPGLMVGRPELVEILANVEQPSASPTPSAAPGNRVLRAAKPAAYNYSLKVSLNPAALGTSLVEDTASNLPFSSVTLNGTVAPVGLSPATNPSVSPAGNAAAALPSEGAGQGKLSNPGVAAPVLPPVTAPSSMKSNPVAPPAAVKP